MLAAAPPDGGAAPEEAGAGAPVPAQTTPCAEEDAPPAPPSGSAVFCVLPFALQALYAISIDGPAKVLLQNLRWKGASVVVLSWPGFKDAAETLFPGAEDVAPELSSFADERRVVLLPEATVVVYGVDPGIISAQEVPTADRGDRPPPPERPLTEHGSVREVQALRRIITSRASRKRREKLAYGPRMCTISDYERSQRFADELIREEEEEKRRKEVKEAKASKKKKGKGKKAAPPSREVDAPLSDPEEEDEEREEQNADSDGEAPLPERAEAGGERPEQPCSVADEGSAELGPEADDTRDGGEPRDSTASDAPSHGPSEWCGSDGGQATYAAYGVAAEEEDVVSVVSSTASDAPLPKPPTADGKSWADLTDDTEEDDCAVIVRAEKPAAVDAAKRPVDVVVAPAGIQVLTRSQGERAKEAAGDKTTNLNPYAEAFSPRSLHAMQQQLHPQHPPQGKAHAQHEASPRGNGHAKGHSARRQQQQQKQRDADRWHKQGQVRIGRRFMPGRVNIGQTPLSPVLAPRENPAFPPVTVALPPPSFVHKAFVVHTSLERIPTPTRTAPDGPGNPRLAVLTGRTEAVESWPAPGSPRSGRLSSSAPSSPSLMTGEGLKGMLDSWQAGFVQREQKRQQREAMISCVEPGEDTNELLEADQQLMAES